MWIKTHTTSIFSRSNPSKQNQIVKVEKIVLAKKKTKRGKDCFHIIIESLVISRPKNVDTHRWFGLKYLI